jgi:shikimate dehydrogenase
MIKAAVLGSPISHSLSPKIHAKAYEILGLEASYEAIEVTEESFPKFYEVLESEFGTASWSGFSLTMPLKEIILNKCRSTDPIAERINSANTLYKSENSWKVTSTDYLAFQNLFEGCKVSIDSKVAIIGGGGTARAAIGALNSKVNAVDVLLRTTERMPGLIKAAPDLSVNCLAMASALDEYDLVIQTTPTGVFDQYVGQTKRANGILLEALYKPWPTKLVDHYEKLGGKVISGKELLVEQALYQIKLFSGKSFDLSDMRIELLSVISSD